MEPINEIVYEKDLPRIVVENRKEAPTGGIIEQTYIEVKGNTLDEVKKIYDKIKNEKV